MGNQDSLTKKTSWDDTYIPLIPEEKALKFMLCPQGSYTENSAKTTAMKGSTLKNNQQIF